MYVLKMRFVKMENLKGCEVSALLDRPDQETYMARKVYFMVV